MKKSNTETFSPKVICDRIWQLREWSGLTDDQLTRYSGFSAAWWYEKKHSKRIPTRKSIERLLEKFPVSEEWITKGTGNTPKEEEVKALIRSATERMVNRVPEMRAAGMPLPPRTGAIMTRPGDPIPVPTPLDIQEAVAKISAKYRIPISIVWEWLVELVRSNQPK